ncbi:MAG: L-threonylcarbamoyladenylate synthase [Bacteroidales bacterium]|jgi:L-threonylcarbamoyladenylate synthase|nr:L-threonylcarbamoyladenylate synthase [Bacteroidales bacterium]MCK9447679.1 L-threonylcarbamoyladenylate synthase [Bacteroidales bacterium]MDD3700183.1 L-threonylcarbamoyladenylate synthase [Bacteroidales bacterium]MDY0370641.1 L-threonylcarbamoyladenylate synthase [Bacteroidales bacterium]
MVRQSLINEAADFIRQGGLVAFPTETVYGLGADALNARAVAAVYALKERPAFDPLIVHISDPAMMQLYSTEKDERLELLARHFWPGPLTLVVKRNKVIPDIVSSGLDSVGMRMPANDIALRLIDAANTPLAAPSANKFGKLSPTRAEHVRKQFPELRYILDGGGTRIGIESTVVTLDEEGFIIIRPGAITTAQLEKILPPSSNKIIDKIGSVSPGMMKSHYSPDKHLYILGESQIPADTTKAALLSMTNQNPTNYKIVEVLSATADPDEIAVNLFGALHRLEEAEVDFIVAEKIEESGLGIAIMDRIRKAAWRHQYT